MRSLRRLLACLLFCVAVAVSTTAPAEAGMHSASDTKCKNVGALAAGQGTFKPDGSIETMATVTKDPILKGTLVGRFVVTSQTSPDIPFAGDITMTAKKGTLTVRVAGQVSASGEFVTSGSVIAGTGDFAGATGDLVIQGTQDATGAFTETIAGQICLSR